MGLACFFHVRAYSLFSNLGRVMTVRKQVKAKMTVDLCERLHQFETLREGIKSNMCLSWRNGQCAIDCCVKHGDLSAAAA